MARARARYEITAEDKTARAFRSVRNNLTTAGRALSGFGRVLGGLTGIGAVGGAVGFAAMIKQQIDAGDQLQKLSQRLGASTQFLSEMRHATELTGVSFNSFSTGIQRMTRRIAEGGKGTQEAISALGLSLGSLQEMSVDDQFLAIADAMQGVSSQSERVKLAFKLFDSEGVSLLQTMDGGADAIERMRDEARKLGLSLSRDQVDQMAEANDAVTRLKATFGGLARELAVDLAPNLTALVDWIRVDAIPAIKDLIGWAGSLGEALNTPFSMASNIVGAAPSIVRGGRRLAGLFGAGDSSPDAGQSDVGRMTGGFRLGERSRPGDTSSEPQEVKSKQIDQSNELLRDIADKVGRQAAVAG